MYDQFADRWIISQFAGVSVPTDECVAVSTTGDATGSYHRYDFHLGSNFFDYPNSDSDANSDAYTKPGAERAEQSRGDGSVIDSDQLVMDG
jgi:hypothetical protein